MKWLDDLRSSRALTIAGAVIVVVVFPILLCSGFLLGRLTSAPDAPPTANGAVERTPPAATIWTCSMHPQIRMPKPGKCPICGMDLIPLDAGADDAGPRRLVMSDAARKLAEIETAPVERTLVAAEIRLVGMVDYDETRLRTVTAWVPGRLDRLFVDYTGVEVRRGDHLVEIYSPELFKAQEELLQAKKRVEDTAEQSEFLRASDRRSLESVREKLRLWGLDDAQIRAIEARGTAEDRVELNSPMAGVVIHKLRQQGEYVAEGTPIYVVADLEHVWVQLDAYESDLIWLRYGQEVAIETEAYPGETFRGWVAFIDPILDRKTRTVNVRVNAENEDRRLKPGMFVHATVKSNVAGGGRVMDPKLAGKWISPMHPEIVKDEPGQCDVCGMDLVRAEELGYAPLTDGDVRPLVVPASAVLRTGRRAVVYVTAADADGREPGSEGWRPTYEGREIVLGPRAGDRFIVRSGLVEGERVVVQGNFKIDSALQIQAKASMMSMPAEGGDDGLGPFRAALGPVYEAYFAAQEALAGDDLETARAALARLGDAASAVDMKLAGESHDVFMNVARALGDAAARAAEAADIEAVREAFRGASVAMLALEREAGHAGDEVHLEAFCPMAFGGGARWLQRGGGIANPFYGASMLTCGSVEQRHPGRGGSD